MARSPRLLSHGRLVVLLGALSAFGPLSMDMYLPGLPSMARDLSAPAWAAQLTITTSMLGLAGGQLVAGPISDALGRRRPLLAGAGRLHGDLAAVRHGSQHLAAAGLPGHPGRRRRGRHRHRARDRARPAHRRRRRALLRPAHARRRPGADPRPAARRRAAARHRLARHLRRARRHRGGAAASRPGRCWPRRSPRRTATAAGSRRRVRVFGGLVRDRRVHGLHALGRAWCSRRWRPTSPARRSCCRTSTALSPQLFSVLFALNAVGIMAASQVSRALVRPLRAAGDARRRRRRSRVVGGSACSSRWSPTSGSPACCPACS